MEVEILFFARVRELAGTRSTSVELAAGATVADALDLVAQRYPGLRDHLARCRTALNEEFTTSDAVISDAGVLAIIPPVSGG